MRANTKRRLTAALPEGLRMDPIRRGASNLRDPAQAARDLAGQLGDRAAAIVFFCSATYDLEKLEAELSSSEIFTALFDLELGGREKQLPGKNYVKSF